MRFVSLRAAAAAICVAMALDRGPWLSTATALFSTWSLLTLLVRLWVKLRHRESWQLDDSTISVAFVFALAHLAVTFTAIDAGYGRTGGHDRGRIEKVR